MNIHTCLHLCNHHPEQDTEYFHHSNRSFPISTRLIRCFHCHHGTILTQMGLSSDKWNCHLGERLFMSAVYFQIDPLPTPTSKKAGLIDKRME